ECRLPVRRAVAPARRHPSVAVRRSRQFHTSVTYTLISLTLATSTIRGQSITAASPSEGTTRGHPRIAVVLSGGSANGFAQIGALQVIQDAGIPIDLVTGTSMGAIIGGLYASGYSPTDLARLATTEDWSGFFRRPTERRERTIADKDDDQRYALTLPLSGV